VQWRPIATSLATLTINVATEVKATLQESPIKDALHGAAFTRFEQTF